MNFDEAITHVQNLSSKLPKEKLLQFYGLYKTATVGKCNTSEPGYFDFQARAKYDSWKKYEHLDSNEAKQQYVKLVSELDSLALESKPNASSTGVSVSIMGSHHEIISEQDKTIFDWVKEGKIETVRNQLKPVHSSLVDDEGMSLLHWVCDRGHLKIVELLVEIKCDANLQDHEGNTPLHYAAISGHVDIYEFLIKNGANPKITNNDGETAEELLIN